MTQYRIPERMRKTWSWMAYFMIALSLLMVVFAVVLLNKVPDIQNGWFAPASFLVLGLIYPISPLITLWIVKEARIVIEPDGITFCSPGLRLKSTWENIERVGNIKHPLGFQRYESLVLRNPGRQECAWWFTLLRKHPEREIPLSVFPNWRDTEMGKEIQQYAPWLFYM